MKNNCNLSINNRLVLRFIDGKAVIVRKDNIDNTLLYLNRTIVWLEEVPIKREVKDIVKLVSFSCCSKDKVYFIEEILIDMEQNKVFTTLIDMTKERPNRLYSDIYKFNDLDNELCLLNIRTNHLTRIENNIKNKFKSIGLEVSNVKLNNIENNINTYELVIEIKDLEILHIVINIDNEIDCGYKVSNTIYSEYYKGLEFNVSNEFKTNEFIDGDIFFSSLIKHPLFIELLKNKSKLLDDTTNVKTNIKVRIMANKYKENK